jgi:hypothetical protein
MIDVSGISEDMIMMGSFRIFLLKCIGLILFVQNYKKYATAQTFCALN